MQLPIQSSTRIIRFVIQILINFIPIQRQIPIILKIIQMPIQTLMAIITINQKTDLYVSFYYPYQ